MLDTAAMALAATASTIAGDVTVNAEGTAHTSPLDLLRVIEADAASGETYATIAARRRHARGSHGRPSPDAARHPPPTARNSTLPATTATRSHRRYRNVQVTRVPVAPDVVPPPNARYSRTASTFARDRRACGRQPGTGELRARSAKRAIDTECIVQVGGQPTSKFRRRRDVRAAGRAPTRPRVDRASCRSPSAKPHDRGLPRATCCSRDRKATTAPAISCARASHPGTFVFFDS